jgi:hypothetical protein
MAFVWMLTTIENTWNGEEYNVELYRNVCGVHNFLLENWNSWRYRADMEEGYGPKCPKLEDIEKKIRVNQTEIILAEFGGDYHYSIFVKMEKKFIINSDLSLPSS